VDTAPEGKALTRMQVKHYFSLSEGESRRREPDCQGRTAFKKLERERCPKGNRAAGGSIHLLIEGPGAGSQSFPIIKRKSNHQEGKAPRRWPGRSGRKLWEGEVSSYRGEGMFQLLFVGEGNGETTSSHTGWRHAERTRVCLAAKKRNSTADPGQRDRKGPPAPEGKPGIEVLGHLSSGRLFDRGGLRAERRWGVTR